MALGPVSASCRGRLIGHYGPAAEHWLAIVPTLMQDAAARWGVRVTAYHDEGHASVIAVGTNAAGQGVLLKAWFDRSRYAYEVAALQSWPREFVPEVRYAEDDLVIAGLELIGGQPGGARRPSDHPAMVANGISALHAASPNTGAFPQLPDYLSSVLLPRVTWRFQRLGGDLPRRYLDRATELPEAVDGDDVLLHADLYRENIPFRSDGSPVFTDPLPMVGRPAFDWAFWVVYYNLATDPMVRLNLASASGRISQADLLPWCVALCLDGLLFYREVGDPRTTRMRQVLEAFTNLDAGST